LAQAAKSVKEQQFRGNFLQHLSTWAASQAREQKLRRTR